MLLMYVTRTRPDTKCPVTRTQNPTFDDWIKLAKVLHYFWTTRDFPLVISASDMRLRGSADASHAPHQDSKCHTGGAIWFGTTNAPAVVTNAPAVVMSKKQTVVAHSSMEAEIIALDAVALDGLWLRGVLAELELDCGREPFTIQQDHRSCVRVIEKGQIGKRSRSVNIKHFWLTEKINNLELELLDVRSESMVADGLTKPLAVGKFQAFRDMILNLDALKKSN